MILGVIENAKRGAAIDSVHGILEAGEAYQIDQLFDGNKKVETTIDLTGNILKYSGQKPDSGTLLIDEKGNMSIIAKYGKYCIEKKFNDTEPKIVDKNPCTIEIETSKIYGVQRSLTTSSTSWERTNDSVGLVANAQVGTTSVQNDFDTIYPWSDIISYNYDIDTKKITAYYGDTNFKFDGSNGEVLTYIPEFYYKRYQDEENEYIYISKEPQEGYTKSEAFSVGRYTMSGDATRVHSRSGYAPLVNTNITQFRTYARNLGEEFSQLDYHYFILQLLYVVEYADYNSQAKLGPGYTNVDLTNSINSGGCDTLGMHSGSVDGTDHTSIIYRGIEDIFGNVFQFVDGINVKDNQVYICYDKNQYESDKFDGCYQKVGYVNAGKSNYVSKLGYDSKNPLVAFPIETSGSASTYISDNYWQNSGARITRVGGRSGSGTSSGLWYWDAYDTLSIAYSGASARLLKTS